MLWHAPQMTSILSLAPVMRALLFIWPSGINALTKTTHLHHPLNHIAGIAHGDLLTSQWFLIAGSLALILSKLIFWVSHYNRNALSLSSIIHKLGAPKPMKLTFNQFVHNLFFLPSLYSYSVAASVLLLLSQILLFHTFCCFYTWTLTLWNSCYCTLVMSTIKALIPCLWDNTSLRRSKSLSKIINAHYGK